ncbi:MAG: DNA polymerase, partial [Bacteroidales bacterium]|nr:DNA polymerase [Bacteroidales bacterium]
MKKLMLIDGMSMVYRAYYALQHNPRINSKGVNTSATLGFTMTLYDLLRTQKPSHIAVAFDLQTPTFRHEQYEPYKANREKMPEDIQASMPHIEKIIEAFRIPVITCEGYEADDIIGTASAMAENEGFDEILMVTGDKDFAQLVSEKTHLYRFGRMGKPDSIYKVAEVQEAFDVERPAQVADILGLWGDSIDNIPGIPGVGEKKAKKLIRQFGSVETLLQHVDEIKNEKLRDQIMQYRDQALLSKHLATIVRDAPIEFSVSRMKVQMPDYWSLKELFAELEFRQFAKKFFTDLTLQDPETAIKVLEGGSQKKASLSAETNSQEPHGQQQTGVKMEFMDRSNQLSLFDGPEKVHPSELTTGDLAIEQHHLAGKDLAICFDKTTVAIAVDADKAYSTTVDKIDAGALKALLESDSLKICYDLKNLKYILQEWDVQLKGDVFDVQLAHYLIDAEARHTLDFISSAIIGFEPSDTAACAAALWQLYPLLLSKLREGKLEKLYYEVELPLVDVLVAMEQEGVRIDVGALKQYSARLTEERNQLEQDIYVLAGGRSFNIASPKQLGEILYDSLKIVEKPPRTATKQYSTAEDVLLKMRDKHPIVEKILEFRSLNKLIGTYLDSFPKLIIPATGRLHTIYNQTVTATGRLSSSNPNLQNIPIRTERGREIRKAFVARNSEYVIMAADYSQIE